jgi:acetyl esterase/lipase
LALTCGANLLFVDYRLAPEHPFPAAYDEAASVYRTLLDSGVPAERMVLMGDTAGGNLAPCFPSSGNTSIASATLCASSSA